MESQDTSAKVRPTKTRILWVASRGGSGLRKLLGMGNTFLTVAVLTVLLWVLADQSQLVEQDINMTFTVASEAESTLVLTSVKDDSGAIISATSEGSGRIRAKVKFQGSRSRMRELQADLQSGHLDLVSYLSPPTYWPGTHSIPVADLLNADEKLRERGVVAIQAEPTTITVMLEEWVLIDKIKLVIKDQAKVQKFQAQIDPPEIAVEVPSSLKEQQPKTLDVELGPIPEGIVPNTEVSATVATEIAGLPVKPSRAKVKVILQPAEMSTAKLGPLPIEACLPPEMVGNYDLEFEAESDKVVEIQVVGPPADLDKLKTAVKERVWAYIRLSSNQAKPTDTYYPVRVEFQFLGVEGVSLVGESKTVKVRLRRKPTEP